MIFARYKGAEKEGFTPGRVYVAKPEMDGSSMVGFGFLEVVDDLGRVVRTVPGKDGFEYLEQVYAVVTRPFEDFSVGEVLALADASEDRKQFEVMGVGFHEADDMEVLDGTNVFPGVMVCDLQDDGRWKKVKRVDGALWVVVEGGSSRFRSPEEFRFPVSDDGDMLVEPILTCLMATGEPGLTAGKRYYLLRTRSDGLWVVRDDKGEEKPYLAGRFKLG